MNNNEFLGTEINDSMFKQSSQPKHNNNSNMSNKRNISDKLAFALSQSLTDSNVRQLSELRLIPLGIELMQLIYSREINQNRHGMDVEFLSPVCVMFLKHILSEKEFNSLQFNSKIHVLFPYLTKLIECDSFELRSIISKIFVNRVQPCLVQYRAMSQPVSPRDRSSNNSVKNDKISNNNNINNNFVNDVNIVLNDELNDKIDEDDTQHVLMDDEIVD